MSHLTLAPVPSDSPDVPDAGNVADAVRVWLNEYVVVVWDEWDAATEAGYAAARIHVDTPRQITVVVSPDAVREGAGRDILTADSIATSCASVALDAGSEDCRMPDTTVIHALGGGVATMVW